MKEVTFWDGTQILIEDIAYQKMQYHRQVDGEKEAGGILLGKKETGKELYIVTDISEPSKKDKRSRSSFIRSKTSAQQVINENWHKSKGEINYLGEWHTHPEYQPTPSSIDRSLIKNIIRDRSNVFLKVFIFILGIDGSIYIGLANSTISNELLFSVLIGGEDDCI